MKSTRCGKKGGRVGEDDTSNFSHIRYKVNIRQPHGEDKWVLGDTGGSLEVRGGDRSFCHPLRLGSQRCMLLGGSTYGEMKRDNNLLQFSKHVSCAKSV